MRILTLSVAASLWAGVALGSEPPHAFEGVWDCEVAVFTFTSDNYNTGSDDMPITDIAVDGSGFVLSFEDDYQLYVALNDDGTLYWFSPASGDSFTCLRQD
ncbi:MAG: hypothetical protein U0934_01490 [Pseudotabrizicola sp.]|uniref:hypothetical protein n=1 Tax=Pseudotabrizicola sp. TaxID=2939647 RepID=UPI002724CD65|nr:hypothetical protein [Pseudotabrizicola sp.]MDO8884155.1 hypothetical protein [Pseudotabrizicola sp.]MDP2083199.1 hypothetical protein [Pseudotabrizicola sp.]MDZ7572616.1 hypothetical protein [Pseudotabrizicola sp.]